MIIGSLIAAWLLCFILTVGITVAYFQKKYPIRAKENYREDLGRGVLFALFSPLSTFFALFFSGFAEHGLQYKRWK